MTIAHSCDSLYCIVVFHMEIDLSQCFIECDRRDTFKEIGCRFSGYVWNMGYATADIFYTVICKRFGIK